MTDTIVAAAARLSAGATTSAELVERSLEAVAAHSARTNAFVTTDPDGARHAARVADAARASGHYLGPLHGIPISLKDLIDVAGVVTTAGSRVLRDRIPSVTAPIVSRLTDAGAILIGRTNLHEFALGTTSDNSAFGPVRHPLDPTRSAGGSSGGSAAAVATGMGLGSIGTDTGGSVRIPAAACGLVGLKPSFGEVPLDGVIPLSPSLDHVGPLARTVQDAAWLHAVLSGVNLETISPPSLASLRLCRLTSYFAAPLDETVGAAFHAALARLTAAGTRVLEAEVAHTAVIADVYVRIVLPEAAHWHASYLETRADDYTPLVRARIEHGRTIPAASYLDAQAVRTGLRAAVDAALDDCDALVLPTLPIVAPPLGAEMITIDPAGGGEPISVRLAMLKHTQLFNLTGHPAISLPMATAGLPAGLQLVGHRHATARLLEVAAACEAVLCS
jgi:aspartyl-tRNA(Asn)/glutamyl-tRNA(Gln) amidotransferase subunit A